VYLTLTEAALGKPLVIKKMAKPDLAERLRRMGLFEGSEIVRLDQEVLVRPIRVRGPRGDAVLGGGMAMKIVVHLDDGRKLPLIEMTPGETGHIEGLTGGAELAGALETLRLNLHDRISFLRQLPPMAYVTVISGGGRVRLTEGMAAKIWGRMQEQSLQFVSARAGQPFEVTKILGGPKARKILSAQGIEPGKALTLEEVAQAQNLPGGVRNPVVISSREGLRLFLEPSEANYIFVTETGPEK
jgi:Fe2+ transport system protein FeoA